MAFAIVSERLDGFLKHVFTASDGQRNGLFTNPADQGQSVMHSMINCHSCYLDDDVFFFNTGLFGRRTGVDADHLRLISLTIDRDAEHVVAPALVGKNLGKGIAHVINAYMPGGIDGC